MRTLRWCCVISGFGLCVWAGEGAFDAPTTNIDRTASSPAQPQHASMVGAAPTGTPDEFPESTMPSDQTIEVDTDTRDHLVEHFVHDWSVVPRDFEVPGSVRATPHPHGRKFCASGCVLSNHPTLKLEPGEFQDLLDAYSTGPAYEPTAPLEKLLYYGRQTHRLLESHGAGPLDREHAEFLATQLRRDRAAVSLRLVDEHGRVRAHGPPTVVPLDIRHVFQMDVVGLQPLVASGTTKRVGLHHLWQRI